MNEWTLQKCAGAWVFSSKIAQTFVRAFPAILHKPPLRSCEHRPLAFYAVPAPLAVFRNGGESVARRNSQRRKIQRCGCSKSHELGIAPLQQRSPWKATIHKGLPPIWDTCTKLVRLFYPHWLVVQEPSWKIWVRQWEGWHPIYEMENKKCLKPPTSPSNWQRDWYELPTQSLEFHWQSWIVGQIPKPEIQTDPIFRRFKKGFHEGSKCWPVGKKNLL